MASEAPSVPKIVFYYNEYCPASRAVNIALNELDLAHEAVHIDISVPRPEWYLKLNPRGQVPTLVYEGSVLVESAAVVRFLADSHPSHLVKTSGEPGGALERHRFAVFVQRFEAGAWAAFQRLLMAAGTGAAAEAQAALSDEVLGALERDAEPGLEDAGPFFAGRERVTLVEVLLGPSLMLVASLPRELDFPGSWDADLARRAPRFKAWLELVVQVPNVSFAWNDGNLAQLKAKLAELASAAKDQKVDRGE